MFMGQPRCRGLGCARIGSLHRLAVLAKLKHEARDNVTLGSLTTEYSGAIAEECVDGVDVSNPKN